MLKKRFKPSIVLFALSFLILSFVRAHAQEPTADEIIAKHLDSIGTKEKRAEIKNRLAVGTSEFESKLPSRKTGGKALLVSDDNNLFFLTSFNSQEYPFEKIGIFNKKISLPHVTSGSRSPLGIFIADHGSLLSEGLFAGSVSSIWNLTNSPMRKGKFEHGGKKSVNSREAYVLNYYPKGSGSEFTIKLFFDAEKFHHVRSEYRHTISPTETKAGILGQQSGSKTALIEDFADFKTQDGLTLPHSYKIFYSSDSNRGTYEFNWGITISQYLFNQQLDADFFTFENK